MSELLTDKEKKKIFNIVFKNKDKSCAITQYFLDCLQIISLSDFAKVNNKSIRTTQYQAKNMKGVSINNRKFVTFIQ